MMRPALAVAVVLMLAPGGLVLADGGPVQISPRTGLMHFVHSHEATLAHKRVVLTLPKEELGAAVVRAEYDLVLRERQTPLTVTVAWPISGGFGADTEGERVAYPAVKFDGRPVAYSLLRFDQLAQPYLRPILERIDRALSAKPALAEKVRALRTACEQQKSQDARGDDAWVRREWLRESGVPGLVAWMKANGYSAPGSDLSQVARGLLLAGLRQRESFEYGTIQCALSWFEPDYEPVDVEQLVIDQWGLEALGVDPRTGQRIENEIVGEAGVVIRLPVILQPGRTHRLVVQYQQPMRTTASWTPLGLVYQMKPARAWALTDTPRGYGQPAEIEIRVPREWGKVGVRPPAKRVGRRGGYTIYRITMDQPPLEDLYLGVDH